MHLSAVCTFSRSVISLWKTFNFFLSSKFFLSNTPICSDLTFLLVSRRNSDSVVSKYGNNCANFFPLHKLLHSSGISPSFGVGFGLLTLLPRRRRFHTCNTSENSEMEVLECSWPILVRSKMTTVVSFWSMLMMGSSSQLVRDAFLLRWRGIYSACDSTGSDYHKIYVIAPAKIYPDSPPIYHKEVWRFLMW